MAIRTQLIKQFGLKKETTWGTAVTVDRFFPVIDFEGEGGPEPTYSEAIISGKLTHEYPYIGLGNESYRFTVGGELYDHSMTALYELILGAVQTTGSGPYTHTTTQAEPLPSFTAQAAVPDETGSVRALTYAGSVAESAEINFETGKRATWSMKASAKSETKATAAATLSYPASLVPVHSQHVAVSLWSSSANVKSAKIMIDNALTYDERRFLGSTTIGKRQVTKDMRSYTFEAVLELEGDFTQYARYLAGTTGTATFTITVGSNTSTISFPTSRIIEGHPKFTGRGVVEQTIKVEGLGWGSFEPLSIVNVNSNATP